MIEITKGIFYPLKFAKKSIIASLSKSSKAFFAPDLKMDQNSLRHVLTFLAHSNGSKMYFLATQIKKWS